MKIFISYGDENFSASLRRICKEANDIKLFDKVIAYTQQDLPKEVTRCLLMCYARGGGIGCGNLM